MTQFLVVYRRSTGQLLECGDLGPDAAMAMQRRVERESLEKDDPDIEVVVLGAPSRKALMRTHARYFRSVPQLAAALGDLLPK